MSPTPLLKSLIDLSVRAGAEILRIYEAGLDPQNKSDGSPVTLADQRAEVMIAAGLAEIAPGVPMLGEESSAEGRTPDLGRRYFCVDPIDGTRDFIAGDTGEFSVNIALIEDGESVLGVVYAPATGAIYAGAEGVAVGGAVDARSGAEIAPLTPIRVSPPRADGVWRIANSRRAGQNAETQSYLTALGPHERFTLSSSLKFCRIAAGDFDLYPRFGDVSVWDAAAGHAILRAAGGGVMTLDGAPLRYDNRPDRLIRGFIAYGAPQAEAAARAALRR